MYKIFVAFRYLTSRPISLVSIIGIFLSVGALIVVISVMSGFLRDARAFIRGTMSDIVITPRPSLRTVDGQTVFGVSPPFTRYQEAISGVEGVRGVAPRFNRGALIRRSDGADPYIGSSRYNQINFVFAMGIDLELERVVSGFDSFLTRVEDGTKRVERLDDPFFVPKELKDPRDYSRDYPSILIGEEKYEALGLRKGYVVTLATLDESSLEEGKDVKAFEQKFFVAGAYRTGHLEFDMKNVIIEMDAAWRWVGSKNEVNEIYVAVYDYANQGALIKTRIEKALADAQIRALVETWEERNSIMLGAVENERTILGVILAFFIIIATFNVYATISMMVTDKTKDIGILVSMGATSSGIMLTFIYCGLIMWLIGSSLGVVAGYLFADNINAIKDFIEHLTGINVFRPDVYNFKEIPVELNAAFIGVIVAGTFIMCLFFSLLPSLRASWMHPVKALRHE